MNTPQIVWIVLASLSVFQSLTKHGESRGTYNFWMTLLGVGIEVWILYAGGFFGK